MLLVIDVGNSNIVLGIYDGPRLIRNWRLSTDKSRTSDEYAVLLHSLFDQAGLGFASIKAAIISSVVPPLTGVMEAIAHDFFNLTPFVVGPGIKTGMPIQYDNPREVGADRIVNAIAGFEKHKGALVIVDFGTATTFDFVNARGSTAAAPSPPDWPSPWKRSFSGPASSRALTSPSRPTSLPKTPSTPCRPVFFSAMSAWLTELWNIYVWRPRKDSR
jgi:type III pantothenate kinase